VGDVMARIPQESSKTRDITGGLPRVADLFEARKPKEPAIMAEATGVVSLVRRPRVSSVWSSPKTALNRLSTDSEMAHINVFEGERVEQGEIIADGERNAHDILRLLGITRWLSTWSRRFRMFIAYRV
jgi:DNA-directed RNA polymerase subunit beta'